MKMFAVLCEIKKTKKVDICHEVESGLCQVFVDRPSAIDCKNDWAKADKDCRYFVRQLVVKEQPK